MDKSTSIMILIAALVAVVCVSAGIAVATNDNDSTAENEDTSEYWYEIGYYGYENDNGTVTHRSVGEVNYTEYNLSMYIVEDNVFSGSYNNRNIVGTVDDGIVTFYRNVGDDVRSVFVGQIIGNMMYAISTDVYSDGTIAAYFAVYSTDADASSEPMALDSILGNWVIQSSKSFDSGGVGTIVGTSLTVKGQIGPVFYGTMEQMIDGTLTDVDFVGTAGTQTVNGSNTGFIVDEMGENWNVLISNDFLLMQTCIVGDDAFTSITAGERFYIRNGSAVSDDVFDVPNIEGKTWTEVSGYTSLIYDSVSEVYQECEIKIDSQSGRLFSGTFNYLGMELKASGFFYGDDKLVIISTSWDNTNHIGYPVSICCFCTLDDDELTVTKMTPSYSDYYFSSAFNLYTTGYVKMSSDVEIPDDTTGHWYTVSSVASYYIEGSTSGNVSIQNLLTSYTNELSAYDLDILEINGNSAIFRYCGDKIVGTYENGHFKFVADINDGDGRACTVYFEGTVVNEHIIRTSELYEYSDGSIASASSIYSTDLIIALPTNVFGYYTGTWSIYEDTAYYYDADGNDGSLLGDGLHLHTHMDVIGGTIEEEVNGAVVSKRFVGVITENLANDAYKALIIDNTGIVYNMYNDGSSIILLANAESDTGDGGLVSAVRLYAPADSTSETRPPVTLDGKKWAADSASIHYANGNNETVGGVSLAFTQSSLSSLIAGDFTFDSAEMEFVGYLTDKNGELKVDGSQYVIDFVISGDKMIMHAYHYGSNQYVLSATLSEVSG